MESKGLVENGTSDAAKNLASTWSDPNSVSLLSGYISFQLHLSVGFLHKSMLATTGFRGRGLVYLEEI